MESILDLYAQPLEKARPLVCGYIPMVVTIVDFDEKPVELHAHVRRPLAMRSGQPQRVDYEYQRAGVRNVFLFLEPKAGQRHTLVTARRTKLDWAKAMRYLVDALYPEAPVIDVVLDNLKTHKPEVLIEMFGKAEADRILKRLVFHCTPKQGSWLNMAEIELSVMARQCTRRRLSNEFTLGTELVAWEQPRNERRVTIRWKFTTDDARRVFAKYYPATSNC